MANLRSYGFRSKGAPSALPSLIIPCPRCGGRLTAGPIKRVKLMATATESTGLEDIAHGCAGCRTELVRTVISGHQS